jgi:hypothetical protein
MSKFEEYLEAVKGAATPVEYGSDAWRKEVKKLDDKGGYGMDVVKSPSIRKAFTKALQEAGIPYFGYKNNPYFYDYFFPTRFADEVDKIAKETDARWTRDKKKKDEDDE